LQNKYFNSTQRLHIRIILLLALFILFQLVYLPLWAQETEATTDTEPQNQRGETPEATDESAPAEVTPAETVPAEAPDYEYDDPEFNDTRVSYPLMILRTIAVMGVIIIGIYFIFRLLIKKKNKLITDSEVVKVLATYPLAANRIIQVVDIGGQVLVLGVSDSSINLITELQDKEVIDRIKLASSKEHGGAGTFRETFMNLLGGKAFTKPGQISHLSGYRKRINRMRKF
jgi:flagellar protein FliO/FliZ